MLPSAPPLASATLLLTALAALAVRPLALLPLALLPLALLPLALLPLALLPLALLPLALLAWLPLAPTLLLTALLRLPRTLLHRLDPLDQTAHPLQGLLLACALRALRRCGLRTLQATAEIGDVVPDHLLELVQIFLVPGPDRVLRGAHLVLRPAPAERVCGIGECSCRGGLFASRLRGQAIETARETPHRIGHRLLLLRKIRRGLLSQWRLGRTEIGRAHV